ncbi:MAG: hypothetical protein KAT05_11370, partial [Spirochaetes bacterium]|nr:hypothetical protein [Spirochaetota bacterium]
KTVFTAPLSDQNTNKKNQALKCDRLIMPISRLKKNAGLGEKKSLTVSLNSTIKPVLIIFFKKIQ